MLDEQIRRAAADVVSAGTERTNAAADTARLIQRKIVMVGCKRNSRRCLRPLRQCARDATSGGTVTALDLHSGTEFMHIARNLACGQTRRSKAFFHTCTDRGPQTPALKIGSRDVPIFLEVIDTLGRRIRQNIADVENDG